MDTLSPVAQYFLGTIGATISGIIYWLVIENLQPIGREPRKFQKLWVAAFLSVLITPFGAWFVSSIFKMRGVARDIKDADK